MRTSLRGLLLSLALTTAAWAQIPPFTVSPAPYQPLSGATAISFGDPDSGFQALPLQFAFPYFGTSYTQVWVSVNGVMGVVFPSGCSATSTTCSLDYATKIPSTGTPQGFIAPFWDDLDLRNAAVVRYVSTPSSFEVEWSRVESFSTVFGFSVTMTVRLTPDGQVRFSYGPKSGASGNASGAAGLENETGTQGISVMAKGTSVCTTASQAGCCSSAASDCTMADWLPDTQIAMRTFVPTQAELVPNPVSLTSLSEVDGGTLAVGFSASISNMGATGAVDYPWRAWVSADRTVSAGDQLIAAGGPVSTDAGDAITITGLGQTSRALDAGAYYVLFEVNPELPVTDGGVLADGGVATARAVVEASYLNNVGSLSTPFVLGIDLVANLISGPTSTGGGSPEDLHVVFSNVGSVPTGTVPFRIYASTDTTLNTAADPLVFSGTQVFGGGETVDRLLHNVSMPSTIPQGNSYFILTIDPDGTIPEASKANNLVVSVGTTKFSRADLVALTMDVLDPLTTAPVRTARFGDPLDVTISMTNAGEAPARSFSVLVAVSVDNTLSLLADTVVVEQAAPDLVVGASQSIPVRITLPMKDRANRDLPTGNYYLFVRVNSTGSVPESNGGNNELSVGPMKLYAPGPDLIVNSVQAPASAGVGETVPVFRSIRNVGNVDAPTVNYRYFISPNSIITTDDIPLLIVAPGGATSPTGAVSLVKGEAKSASELVRLPATMLAGTYWIGCIVDPENTVAELSELNNGASSNSVVVAGATLKVATTQLPDAVVGLPYLFRLAALGEVGPSSWSFDPAQGLLPDGLTLTADGLLSGTPTGKEGALVSAFTAVVSNNALTAQGRLAFRVLPPSSQVVISSVSIPPVVNSSAVQFQYGLGAAGGVRPYTWRVAAGTLPGGLSLSSDGVLSGAPRAGVADGMTSVTFEVRDATGSTVRKDLSILLVSAGSIAFRTTSLPDAILGGDYGEDIAVQNLDGSALAKPLTWTQAGALPPGLVLNEASEVAYLAGKPTQVGTFTFTITVADAKGRSDSLDFSVTIHAARLRIAAALPAPVRPGEQVNVAFTAQPSTAARFAVVSGVLPPGLSMAGSGLLSGTVATEQSEGTWSFVVQAVDVNGASGLVPFGLTVERAPPKQGCGSTDGGFSPVALLALALLILRRRLPLRVPRQGRRLGGLTAAALAVLPLAALGQTGAYVVDGPKPYTYQPIVGGTAVSPGSFSGVTVVLPFSFNFYGTQVSSVTMTRYGYLALLGADDTDDANKPIPHNSAGSYIPATLIAPWWDYLSGGTFKWVVTGGAPNRVAIFEWINVYASGSSSQKISFQAQIFEASGQLRFAYGPSAPGGSSASIGVMRSLGVGLGTPGCGSVGNCNTSDFPKNQAYDFLLPADLSIASVSADPSGYAGVAYRASVAVHNGGGSGATGVVVRLYLSTDKLLDSADPLLGETTVPSVSVRTDVGAQITGLVPSGTSPGSYFVLAVVDPDNQILEQNEDNNAFFPQVMTVADPRPDLVVTSVTAPGTVAPGATLQVTRSLSNAGNASMGPFKYSWFLSSNPVVTIADRALSPVGTLSAGLAAHASDTAVDTLAVPSDLKPGQYWLGVCVNYDSGGAIAFLNDEISWLNNCAGSHSATVVSAGTLVVTTTTLPVATQYSPWGVRLAAVGGDGSYVWALTDGALPPGMAFNASGDLTGSPAITGSFSFGVKVTSAGQEKAQALSLQVSSGNLPLVVVDQDLPAAEFGRAYQATVVAVGGKPPYEWSVTGGALPAGLALAPDGHLEGRAAAAADGVFTAQVTDATGAAAAKELKVRVVNPSSLSIATQALAAGQIQHDYLQPLIAVGGRPPYSWAVTSFRHLAENATEQPGALGTELPAEIGLTLENANTGSFLRGVAKLAGLYSLGLKVTDASNSEDSATLQLYVTYKDGLAITTVALPDAFIGMNYSAKLSHNADATQQGVKFGTTCIMEVRKVGEFACVQSEASQQLPAGLNLSEDGTFGGGVDAAVPAGVFSFLVKVTDGWGRQDVRGMSIRVRAMPVEKTGCSGTGLEPSLVSLLALAGVALRARRSGRRN